MRSHTVCCLALAATGASASAQSMDVLSFVRAEPGSVTFELSFFADNIDNVEFLDPVNGPQPSEPQVTGFFFPDASTAPTLPDLIAGLPATGRFRVTATGGAVSVYEISLAGLALLDLAPLPTPTGLTGSVNLDTSVDAAWTIPPATPGLVISISLESVDGTSEIDVLSQTPFTLGLVTSPFPLTTGLSGGSYTVPAGTDGTEARLELAYFLPQAPLSISLVSGPGVTIGQTGFGVTRDTTISLFMPASVDADGDGDLDGDDQMQFIASVNAMDPDSDLDGNGVSDVFDIIEYLRRFDGFAP